MSEEIWKDIKDYEGLYQVSSLGRVKSLDRTMSTYRLGEPHTRVYKGKILKGRTSNTKVVGVNLSKEGKVKMRAVHRLVAETFIPNPQNKPEVNHKDRDRTNNKLSNLEWMTSAENKKHASETGFTKTSVTHLIRKYLKKHPDTKPKELAEKYGVGVRYAYRMLEELK